MTTSSCLICGCIKNCDPYIEKVFKNIELIQRLFITTKIIISFDISSDFSLKILCRLKKQFDIDIIINQNPVTAIRTVNIENARNKILDLIYGKYARDYSYFIMIDMDDVSAKPINIEALQHGLENSTIWDGLFFNNENYYDFWALNFDDFQYSCWHSSDNKKLINIMNNRFKNKMATLSGDFLSCQSAFGGFGIYKTERFINCRYRSLIDKGLFNISNLNNIYNKYQISYNVNNNIYDCEHRYYHLNAIRANKVKLMISKKCLFPRYVGTHTDILDK